jgi:hypothetical protein
MKKKMGRPKKPKSKVRGIVVQARLSPEEERAILDGIRPLKKITSEWVRKALLFVAKSETTEA